MFALVATAIGHDTEDDKQDEYYTYECVQFTDDYCTELAEVPVKPNAPAIPFWFDAEKEIYFYLFTKETMTNPQKFQIADFESAMNNFDANKPTKIVIHGYFNNKDSPINKKIVAAYLPNYDVNVIVVDWGAGANNVMYNIPAGRTRQVAAVLAKLLDKLNENNTKMWNELTIIGHSLGAHTAGFTGKLVNNGKIGKIVGLDPAGNPANLIKTFSHIKNEIISGPLFRGSDIDNRLCESDAKFVEVIHTNARRFGLKDKSGSVDFFPNYGHTQPNCGLLIHCDIDSHSRSIDLFVESLTENNFVAQKCPSHIDVSKDRQFQDCDGEIALFGGEPGNLEIHNVTGIFYFATNGKPVYGMGTKNLKSQDMSQRK